MSQKMNYYLLCSFCKKGKNFKIFYDAFDENDRFILSESTNKIYSFFCCDRTFHQLRYCIQQRDNGRLEISIGILCIL